MRNRPDSRGRLAGIRPPGPPDVGHRVADEPLDEPLDELLDETAPIPDDDDSDGWVREPPAAHRRAEPSEIGGWVPDLWPPLPAGRRRPGPAEPPASDPDDDHLPTVDPLADHRARRVRYSPHHAWGRVAQRWIPEPLREARIDPGRRGALLLAVVAAVAAVVAAVGVWRGQPEARPVQTVSLAQVSDASGAATGRVAGSLRPATAAPATTRVGNGGAGGGTNGGADGGARTTGTTSGGEVLIVSVTGAVRHPGLVRVPPGSRVADAIAQAGGATDAADLTGVNLAARLADGASVVVSDDAVTGGSSVSGLGSGTAVGAASTTGPAGQPAGKVDLNTADATTLDALPGVGPVTAAAIVAWRNKNGRYTSVEQLQEIAGIGPAKYAALAALVTV